MNPNNQQPAAVPPAYSPSNGWPPPNSLMTMAQAATTYFPQMQEEQILQQQIQQAALNAIMNQPIQQVELVQVPHSRSYGYFSKPTHQPDQSVSGSQPSSTSSGRKRRLPPIRTHSLMSTVCSSPLPSPTSPTSLLSPPVSNAPIMLPAPQGVNLSIGASSVPNSPKSPSMCIFTYFLTTIQMRRESFIYKYLLAFGN